LHPCVCEDTAISFIPDPAEFCTGLFSYSTSYTRSASTTLVWFSCTIIKSCNTYDELESKAKRKRSENDDKHWAPRTGPPRERRPAQCISFSLRSVLYACCTGLGGTRRTVSAVVPCHVVRAAAHHASQTASNNSCWLHGSRDARTRASSSLQHTG
jgi:hypothetical protein